jgi:hypothetical protein
VKLESLLATWAARYEVETVLERIVGSASSVCAPLVARGGRVTVARDDSMPEGAIYDLVVVQADEAPVVNGGVAWREWLTALAKHAAKLVVVETANPPRPSVLARILGAPRDASSWGGTAALAPVLWDLGRVREHAFLDVPDGMSRKKATLVASRHAFVIDVTPRTPQARRKRLGTV